MGEDDDHECCMCGEWMDQHGSAMDTGHMPVSMRDYYNRTDDDTFQETAKMNYSTAVFLINKHVRAIIGTYEATDNAPRTIFKTLDDGIAVGDFVVVPTDTRHKMTIVKVVETDVDPDFESSTQVQWIVGKVDRADFELHLREEAQAITAIKAAELKKKRADLAKSMFDANYEELKALPIAALNGDTPKPTE